MKNRLKRLLSLVLVLVTAVSMLPVTPASAAGVTNPTGIIAAPTTVEMPERTTLKAEFTKQYAWQSNLFWNNEAGRYYFYDYNFMGLETSAGAGQILAVCTNRGATTGEGVGYTMNKSAAISSYETPGAKYYAAFPFLDYYAQKFYGGQLSWDETYLYKVFANSMVWGINSNLISTELLTQARNFTSVSSLATTSQLYKAGAEYYQICLGGGTSDPAGLSDLPASVDAPDIATGIQRVVDMVKQWDAGAVEHREYYQYNADGNAQSLMLATPYTVGAGGYVAVKKTDETGVLLAGAEFTAYYEEACTSVAGQGTADAKGIANFSVRAPEGYDENSSYTYYVKETKAPEGYMLPSKDADPYSVTVSFTANKEITNPAWVNGGDAITNEKFVGGYIVIEKCDQLNHPLAGAQFTLFDEAGTKPLSIPVTTDSTGKAYIPVTMSSTEWGTDYNYTVKETKVPDGYTGDTSMGYPVTVDFTKNTTKETAATINGGKPVVNEKGTSPTPDVGGNTSSSSKAQILKKDSKTNANIGGAVFSYSASLYSAAPANASGEDALGVYKDVSGTTDNGSFADSDNDGIIDIQWTDPAGANYTAPGHYTIWEKTPPAGYELTDEKQTLELWVEITREVESVTTDPETGKTTTVYKYITTGKCSTGTLTFTNDKLHTVQLIKQDASGKKLPGALFNVYKDGKLLQSNVETDSTGTITLDSVESGYYEFEETKAPDGFLLPTDNRHGVMLDATDTSNTNHTINIVNYAYPEIVIQKYHAGTTTSLAGAVFNVEIDGAKVGNGSFTTDGNGQIVIPYTTYGSILSQQNDKWTVTVTETNAPAGYLLNETPQSLVLERGKTMATFEFENEPVPGILITKEEEGTNKRLPGATYEVSIDNTPRFTKTTDANGTINITPEEYGKYMDDTVKDEWDITVKEITPPDGYLLNSEPQTLTLREGQTLLEFSFENIPYSDIVVLKVDEVTGDALPGATFELVHKNGTVAARSDKTDMDGKILFEKVQPGTYTLRETKAPEGYLLDENNVKTVVIAPGCDPVLTFQFANEKKPTLTIVKLDAITKDPLQNTYFLVERHETSGATTELGTYPTGENGKIELEDLPEGWYSVTETTPTDGYQNCTTPTQKFYLQPDENKVITFENNPLHALIIKKTDSATGKGLAGATFRVSYLSGTSGTGGTVIGETYTTTANGTVTITRLQPGTYTVEEISAPDGYVVDTTPKTVYLTDDEQVVVTVEFTNSPKGELIIVKVDSVTKLPLAGAKFKITNSSGTVTDNYGGTVSSNGLYTTDAYGQIKLFDLEPDTYVVTEVESPDGYVLDSTPQTVRVNTNDTQTLTFTNTPIGGFILIKEDGETGERLKGAEFEIREMDGEIIDTYTTDSNGKIYLPELSSGWYVATELKAPKGYRLDDTPTNIEVEDGKTTTVTVKNEKVSNIVIHKVDSGTGEGLYGAVFVIYDSKSNPIGEYTSDDRGYVYVEDIPDGRYKIREIEAPEGYLLDNGYKTVYVRYGGSSEVTWKNTAQKGQIQVAKYAGQANPVTGTPAGAPLPGAVFEIAYERSGRVAGYITTDARGIAASKPLPLGRYIVKEVTAPAYYQLSNQTFDVTIEYPNQIIKLGAYNDPAVLDVSITKTGIKEVLAGSNMSYNISVANTSNVALEQFYWHDRLPTDVTLPVSLTTGTYNQRLNYRILYRTNYNDYRVLASNLNTGNNYAFVLNNLPLMAGEVVTDIHYDFGTVPAAFQSVIDPTVTVSVKATTPTGYQIVNRGDVGGLYQGTWETGITSWITITRNFTPTPQLPKTGY